MISMASHELAEGTNELVIHHAVHVDLLILVLQAGQATDLSVWHRLHQAVAGEGLLVWVRCTKAAVTVRYLARHTRLDGLTWRVLLTKLAADSQIHCGNCCWIVV